MRLATLSLVLLSTTSFALPPGHDGQGLVSGANHHVGDAGFVATYGRTPNLRDPESVRMRTHLAFVRDRLARMPATRPDLQAKRDQVIGFLSEYVAKGTTPKNLHLPWRTPVFIDDDQTICAVGYLIERSTGRALPEKIAATHRYDLIEDIARAMPEVGAWVEASGFTLEEIASIQPGYIEPTVESWRSWPAEVVYDDDGKELPAKLHADGPVEDVVDGVTTTSGTFARGLMQGAWTVTDTKGHVVGKGDLTDGRGMWHSAYPGGARLAEGPMRANSPHGAWRFYHPSGNLAAEGSFLRGTRHGAWRFYYDTPAQTPIALGSFWHTTVDGTWRHFDQTGHLIATSIEVTPSQWERRSSGGHLLSITPGTDGVRHEVHQGNVNGDNHRLDGFYRGAERLYLRSGVEGDEIFDADGYTLKLVDGAWTSRACHWSAKRKQIAHNADITTLHGLLDADAAECDGPATIVAARRAQQLDTMLSPMRTVRAQSATFVRELALGGTTIDEAVENGVATAPTPDAATDAPGAPDDADDLARVLAANMTWYVEWPHIDGRFEDVFRTVAGYRIQMR
ncbi:MAG: hypothetical protein NT062_33645 [Proteobacteria bacterium]|nr:hypothetical protein [Pseudomonadota bacterium]